MANKYLSREDAPFGADLWAVLDGAMVEIARSQLAGRRLLDLDGPYGLGLKAVPLTDTEAAPGVFTSPVLPVALIQRTFKLGRRNLAAFERDRISLDLTPLVEATLAVARMEDDLVFNGTASVPGVLATAGIQRRSLSSWDEVGTAANDVIRAVTLLDGAGFHGPYSLALPPERYNLLFRLYPQGNGSELEHIRTIVGSEVVKAPGLQAGGILVASNRQFASIVLGQDLSIGFIGPTEDSLEFSVSESLAVLVRVPKAVCVLDQGVSLP